MPAIQSFHEVRFPTAIALGSHGGPVRSTRIVTLGSGAEQRVAGWANSRRRFNAGYGVKTIDDLHDVIAFFEERRGRLFGFRYRDPLDWKSCRPGADPDPLDQLVAIGDGEQRSFPLIKTYGTGETAWARRIGKPVEGTVRVAMDGMLLVEGIDFEVDTVNGTLEFLPGKTPPPGEAIHAGYEFDVPVRFDTDEITVNLATFLAGEIATIPLLEILS